MVEGSEAENAMTANDILPYVPSLTALLTAGIGVGVWYLGYLQHKTNALRLKHELLERRYKVYVSFKQFISLALREGKMSFEDGLSFLRETNEAEFLFGPEIPEYLNLAFTKGNDLERCHRQISGGVVSDDRHRVIEESTALMKWFSDQYNVAQERFRKYLNLTKLE
jgi:hypothetical protein